MKNHFAAQCKTKFHKVEATTEDELVIGKVKPDCDKSRQCVNSRSESSEFNVVNINSVTKNIIQWKLPRIRGTLDKFKIYSGAHKSILPLRCLTALGNSK